MQTRSALLIGHGIHAWGALKRLRRRGWQTHSLPTVDIALRHARTVRPDLILLGSLTDEVAQGRGPAGYEVVRTLKQDPATCSCRVVMVTSVALPEHRQKAEQAGVDAYLVAPIDDDELEARLLELVAPG